MLTACDSVRSARPLLGTFVEIAVAGAAHADMNAAVAAAFAAVAKVHDLMSFHEAGSDVSRLNERAWKAQVCVHAWTFRVLQAATNLHRRSAGAFDVAIAPVLQDMRLLPRQRHFRPSNPGRAVTTQAIELLPGRRVRFQHPDVRIDLGGIAKGFAVDCAIDILRRHGMLAALVNAGGDLAGFGPNAHAVDLRDPRAPGHLLCRLGVSNAALASSGGCFDPFVSLQPRSPAVIDPRSRKPACLILAATVRAPTCMLADALTKVVMVAGASAASLLEHYRAGALIILSDGGVQITEDLQGAVHLAA